MSAMTRPTDVLRNELQAFAPSSGAQYGVFYRWAPLHVSNLSAGDWELIASTSQHDLAEALADLYGAIQTDSYRIDTMVKML